MPSSKESGRGWYTSKRENGFFAQLLAKKYKRDEFYARIFPVPVDIDQIEEQVQLIKASDNKKRQKPKATCSTITGSERNYKTLCIFLLNGLLEKGQVKAQFVEIDIVSCHARVLCLLFPDKTPLLNAVFKEGRNLWGEIISYIPSEIETIISKTTSAKKIVKIVAYKTLQSGLVKHESILKAIKDSIYGLSQEDQYTVVEAMRTNPVLTEFRTLFKEISRRANDNNLRVYSLFQGRPLEYDPDVDRKKDQVVIRGGRGYSSNPFRFCSSILVGVELIVLCGIINTLSSEELGIPVSLEHDGCLCLIDVSEGPLDMGKNK